MKNLVFFALGSLCFLVALNSQQSSEKKVCKQPGFEQRRTSLEKIDLTVKEKQEIAAFAKRGRKIDAIRIMRRCSDMSLKEQKAIVDALNAAY
jgi:ribosomal protein L7/L12